MTVRTIDAQPQEIKKRRVAAYCRVSTDVAHSKDEVQLSL